MGFLVSSSHQQCVTVEADAKDTVQELQSLGDVPAMATGNYSGSRPDSWDM